MKTLVAISALTIFSFAASAQGTDSIANAKIKKLYSCYYFYQAGTRSSDQALRAKSTEIANQFLFKATALTVDAGEESYANKLSLEGQDDLRSFLSRLLTASEETRNKELDDFDTSCSSDLDARIEYKRRAPPEKVVRLFSCAHFYKSTAQSSDASEREALLLLSSEFLSKAKALVSDVDSDSSESELSQQGEKQSAAFLAGLSDSANESTKEARLRKFKGLCAKAGKVSLP